MYNLTENELIKLVVDRLDPDDIVEILQLNSSDLAEAFSDKIVLRSKEIQEYVDYGDDYEDGQDDAGFFEAEATFGEQLEMIFDDDIAENDEDEENERAD